MAKSISLFYLVAVVLQTMGVSSTAITRPYQASITVDDDDIKANSLSNIYLDYGNRNIQGTLTLTFGDCVGDLDTPHTTIIGSADISDDQVKPTKFVWATPGYTKSGCIFAIDDKGKVFAKSERYTISSKISKRGHPELDDMHFDAVNFYKVRASNHGNIVAASDKSEKIGIIGAGMSGLFSALLLEQAGLHNYEILEANNRLGGRVHTTYFKGNTHSLHGDENSIAYQEMGPMRIPISIKYNNKTLPVTDHDILFQMANELNTLNKNDQKYKIDFIDWIQSTENNLYYKHSIRLPNGKVPTIGQASADASLSTGNRSSSAIMADNIAARADEASATIYKDSWFELMSKDLYAAHEKAIKEGFDDWSEWGWLHHRMGADLHVSEYAANQHSKQIWTALYDKFAKSVKDARTVQGGMTRLAKAYEPIIGDKVKFGVRVTKIDHEDGKVSVQWKNDPYDTRYNKKSFDNVIISVPFSIVRTWHLPELPYTLRSAIDNLRYGNTCKVAMEFKTRFWEHYEIPIHGGCDTTDLYAGEICYPSNNIASEGPGVMLASYSGDDAGLRFASMTEKQHVARVLEDMVELHGDIAREQYTGNYDRVCWILDEFQSGAWASPEAGQHKLYMPSYFEMNKGIVFVGEHTDIKHAWISAALESAIRGVVMVLVEHGHVKEAKALVKKWDAKWLKI